MYLICITDETSALNNICCWHMQQNVQTRKQWYCSCWFGER